MAWPTVSVIIAAYNAMPYLTRCVISVAEQSIGRGSLEVIAVDDGSTDGTGEELDRLSLVYPGLLKVIHQENSGGPSMPRNVGLDEALGRFVFFLDADDYLGPEALERMVAAAEENGTDVVLGKMVGVGGREAPTSMFQRNQSKAGLFSSRVYWTLNPMKLFRRGLLERHGLRFPQDLSIGEDQLFVGQAYLHACDISVVADYDCLYWVEREDSGNITLRTGGTEPRLKFLARVIDMLLDRVPAGPGRDHLAHRHLTVDVSQLLDHLVCEPRIVQQKALTRLAEIIKPLCHNGLSDRLSAMARLRLYLVRNGMLEELIELVAFEKEVKRGAPTTPLLIEDGRAYARYLYLRDPARAIPDSCYEVTSQIGARHHISRAVMLGTTLHLAGYGYLHQVETHDVSTDLVLRERESGVTYRLPVTHTATLGLGADEDHGRFSYELAGFEAAVDVTTAADGRSLSDGLWDISLTIGAQGLTKEVRIGSKRADDVSGKTSTRIIADGGSLRAVSVYTTKPHGNFTLDLGETKHKVLPHLSLDGTVRWAVDAPTELELIGGCSLAEHPEGELKVVLTNEDGYIAAILARQIGNDGKFVVRVPATELAAGRWRGELRLGHWNMPLLALPEALPPIQWRRRALPWQAGPAADEAHFVLEVARSPLVKAVKRWSRRVSYAVRRTRRL